ncbi:MAG TPA: hypothetical protein VMT43_06755, partial [Acidimicrobiales bacterium]|nr:hypothetical protein [Acidimicrobiales bacterium]
VRSYQYAVEAGLRGHAERNLMSHDQLTSLARRGQAWLAWVTVRFLGGYLDAAAGESFVPSDPGDLHDLLTAYVLDKALYEVRYDLDHRPSWAPIPLRGLASMISATA